MRTSITRTILLATAFALAACSDATAPQPGLRSPSTTVEAAVSPTQRSVYVLRRKRPLAEPITTSATIGFGGGKLAIPEAGLKVEIPVGALLWPTTITVTALAGENVAYRFGPHGQLFLKRINVSQALNETYSLNSKPQYRAAYYLEEPTSWEQAVVSILELLTTSYDRKGQTATFGIIHFSGYLMSSGFADNDLDLPFWQ